jgi:hypothetical protein
MLHYILEYLKLYAFHISYISTIHLSVRFSLAASMLGPVCELLRADAFGVAPEWDKPHTQDHGNFLHLSLLRPPRPRESLVTGYRLPDSLGQTSGGPAFTKRPFNIFDNLRLWLCLANDAAPAKTESQISSKWPSHTSKWHCDGHSCDSSEGWPGSGGMES